VTDATAHPGTIQLNLTQYSGIAYGAGVYGAGTYGGGLTVQATGGAGPTISTIALTVRPNLVATVAGTSFHGPISVVIQPPPTTKVY
jgi:hypothetical protein